MINFQRSIRILVLLALLITAFTSIAQDEAPITVVGSGIVNPVMQAVIDSNSTDLTFDLTVTGSSAGFEAFCNGAATITTANRLISVDENTLCLENGVEFYELLIAYDVLTIIRNPEDDVLTCASFENLDAIFAPSATGVTTNWSQIEPKDGGEEAQFPDLEMTVLVPPDNTLTYSTLDNLIAGFGIRSDVTTASVDEIISTVNSTSGAIGVVPLAAALDSETLLVDIDFGAGCQIASVETAEDRLYQAATQMMVYVNKAQADTLRNFLNYLASNQSDDAIIAAGYSPVSIRTMATNIAVVNDAEDSQAFSGDIAEYTIPASLIGELNLGGSMIAYPVANSASATLAQGREEQLVINKNFLGDEAGITAFCNNELDVLFVSSADDVTCEDETPELFTFDLGAQAVVLVGHSVEEGEAVQTVNCVTPAQISTMWGVSAGDAVTNWNQVSEALEDQDMTLFAISESSILNDILLTSFDGSVVPPLRDDIEFSDDVLYRAAAVANVPGALTYMSWSEYQQVLNANQSGIQLVGVNDGNECVFPDETNISDGSYPLSRQASVVVYQSALARLEVQGYLWTFFGDANYNAFTNANFYGVELTDVQAVRDDLQVAFRNAEEAAAAATEEAANATDESTTTEEPAATEEAATTDESVATEEAVVTEEAVTTEEPVATEEAAPEEPAATEEASND